jgi:hypothetical protein
MGAMVAIGIFLTIAGIALFCSARAAAGAASKSMEHLLGELSRRIYTRRGFQLAGAALFVFGGLLIAVSFTVPAGQ